jgi:hypothetical protein
MDEATHFRLCSLDYQFARDTHSAEVWLQALLRTVKECPDERQPSLPPHLPRLRSTGISRRLLQ